MFVDFVCEVFWVNAGNRMVALIVYLCICSEVYYFMCEYFIDAIVFDTVYFLYKWVYVAISSIYL